MQNHSYLDKVALPKLFDIRYLLSATFNSFLVKFESYANVSLGWQRLISFNPLSQRLVLAFDTVSLVLIKRFGCIVHEESLPKGLY